ncbi:MAG: tetratricopeptide repeat protein [Pseudomonadota bacterium]
MPLRTAHQSLSLTFDPDRIPAAIPGLGCIYAQRPDRLGARLTAMLNAIRLCTDYRLPLAIGWGRTGTAGSELAAPEDLFDRQFIDRYFIDPSDWAAHATHLKSLSPKAAQALSSQDLIDRIASGEGFHCGIAFGIAVLSDERRETVAQRYAQTAAALPLTARLSQLLGEINTEIDRIRPCISYHIRRGDIVKDPVARNRKWPTKFVPSAYYDAHMDQMLTQGARLLVFSDSPEEIVRLRARCDIHTVDDLLPAVPLSMPERAIIELFAMARTDRIVAPESSAFSSTAAEIGGADKIALPAALGTDDRERASRRIIRRIESGQATSEPAGIRGQELLYAVDHLVKADREGRAARLLDDQIRGGLDLAFLYPLLLNLHLRLGDAARAATLWQEVIAKRVVLDDAAMGQAACQTAVALTALGQWGEARELLTIGIWHAPLEEEVALTASLLSGIGIATTEDGFPADPALATRMRLPGARLAAHPYLGAVNFDGESLPRFHADLLARDWRGLLNRRLNRAFGQREKIVKRSNSFAKLAVKAPGPGPAGALSVYARALGDTDLGLCLAKDALVLGAPHALGHKRVADAHGAAGNAAAALNHAELAAEAAPGHPCYLADLAKRRKEVGNRDGALDALERAAASDPPIPDVHLRLAQALRAEGRTEEALTAVRRAVALAPASHRLRQEEAATLSALGERGEAAEILTRLDNWGRALPGALKLHAKIRVEMGDADSALALAERALAGSPDSADLQELVHGLREATRLRALPDYS